MSSSTFKKGFTLVELIVVMAIASIMMTVMIIQQSSWNDRLSVNTKIYEMALIIRQAQTFGTGVREYTAGTGDKFDIGYGVFFDTANTGQYIYFADKDDANKGKYNAGELVDTETLTRGVTINKICGKQGGIERCSPFGALSRIAITFFRPDAKANILFMNSSGNVIGSYSPPARIYLSSPGGKLASVKVEANGQVSIIQ